MHLGIIAAQSAGRHNSYFAGVKFIFDFFFQIIGAEYIKAMHINDSAADLASHKDRHASLGEGMIGLQAFQKIVSHEKVRQLPLILETPSELAGWKKEIELLRKYQKSEGDLS